MIRKNTLKIFVIIIISGVCALFASIFAYTKILEKWELKFTNNFFTQNTPSEEIIIVGVDQKTLNALGTVQNWPRTYYAKVVENISKDKPKVIGLDVLFRSPSNFITTTTLTELLASTPDVSVLEPYSAQATHPYDAALAESIKNAGSVFLIKRGNLTNTENITENLYLSSEITSIEPIKNAALVSSYNAITTEVDGTIRRMAIGFFTKDIFSSTFAFSITKFLFGLDPTAVENPSTKEKRYTINGENSTLNIPLQQGFTLINYGTQPYPNGYKTISFSDVYNNSVPAGTFKNKIVLIGWVDQTLKDSFATPHLAATGTMMPGVEIHANAIQMLLEGNFLEEESPLMVGIMTFFYALLIAICASYLRIRWAPLYLAVFFIEYWFFAKYAFAHGLPGISGTSIVNGETVRHKMLFAIATPYLAMAITYLTTLSYRYATEVKARLALKTAFSYYLAPAVVEKIADKPEQVRLGGERREMSFLFSDIHDFTPFSESRDPAEVARTLNEYFTAMADCVFAEGGTLDKFEGDALMAFWGAPLEQPDHAIRAIRAALRMRIALKKLHEKWATENRPLLTCRIGINSGAAVVGNMGSNRRFDYTAIGDNVNLAARLEQANKQFNSTLLISDDTMTRMQTDKNAGQLATLHWQKLGEITVKGKSKAITVWTLPE